MYSVPGLMWRMISGSNVILLRLGTGTTNPIPWSGQRPPKTHLCGRQRPMGPFFLLESNKYYISGAKKLWYVLVIKLPAVIYSIN